MTAPDYADRPQPDAWRDDDGMVYVNLRKHPDPFPGAYDPSPGVRPLYLTGSAQLTALLDERKALIRERDEAQAKVKAVEALAFDATRTTYNPYTVYVADLRAAIGFQKPVDKV